MYIVCWGLQKCCAAKSTDWVYGKNHITTSAVLVFNKSTVHAKMSVRQTMNDAATETKITHLSVQLYVCMYIIYIRPDIHFKFLCVLLYTPYKEIYPSPFFCLQPQLIWLRFSFLFSTCEMNNGTWCKRLIHLTSVYGHIH